MITIAAYRNYVKGRPTCKKAFLLNWIEMNITIFHDIKLYLKF